MGGVGGRRGATGGLDHRSCGSVAASRAGSAVNWGGGAERRRWERRARGSCGDRTVAGARPFPQDSFWGRRSEPGAPQLFLRPEVREEGHTSVSSSRWANVGVAGWRRRSAGSVPRERFWPHEEKERGRRGRAGTLATPGARPGAENGRGGRRAGKSWRGDKTRVLAKETAVSCVAIQMLAAPLGAPGLRRSRPVCWVMDEQGAGSSGSLI